MLNKAVKIFRRVGERQFIYFYNNTHEYFSKVKGWGATEWLIG